MAITGKDTWIVYTTPLPTEHDERLGKPCHAVRFDIEFKDDTLQETAQSHALLRSNAREMVLHDWPDAADWIGRTPYFTVSHEEATRLLDAVVEGSEVAARGFDCDELVRYATDYMRKESHGTVRRPRLVVPVGTTLLDEVTPGVLLLTIDMLGYAFNAGTEDVKAQITEKIRSIYQTPRQHVKEVGECEWELSVASINCAHKHRHDWPRVRRTRALGQSEFDKRREDKKKWGMRWVTSVTPFAVAVMPWLAEATQSEARKVATK